MARRFALETILNMQDGVTRPVRQMADNVRRQASVMERAMRRVTNAMFSTVGYLGIAGIGGAVFGLGSQFLDFDHNIKKAVSRLENFNIASKEGQEILKSFSQEARRVGSITEHTAAQAAGGLAFFTKAGYTAQQSLALLNDTANLATGADVEFARAADIASDVLGAFNKATKDSVLLQQRYTKAINVMAKTVNAANQDVEEMFGAIKKGAAVFVDSGQSMETFATMTALLANASIKGEEAGTALKTGIIRLQAPVSEGSRALKKLGIDMFDQSGSARNLIEVLQELSPVLNNLSDRQRVFAMNAIFGKRHINRWSILIRNAATPAMQEMYDKIKDNEGALKNIADIMRTSFTNKLKIMVSSLIELGIVFVEVFRKEGKSGIESMTDAIRSLAPQVKSIAIFFREYGAGMLRIIGLMLTFKAIVWTVALAISAFGAALTAYRGIIIAVTLAQTLWNAALIANPVGAFITAIATLVTLGAIFYQNWDKITKLFKDMWAGPIYSAWAFLSTILQIIAKITGLSAMWSATVSGVKGLGQSFSSDDPSTQATGSRSRRFLSPESQAMIRGRNSRLDVNFNNLPAGTTTKRSGDNIPEINLALGAN